MSFLSDDDFEDMAANENGTWFTTPPWTHNDTDPSEKPLNGGISLAEKITETLLLSMICMVALSGNILLWCVVLRNKTLRTTSNALVLCLSSADILVSVVNMPITILTIIGGDWLLNHSMCVMFGFANMTFFIGSVMSLAAISLNRYVLIVHPKRFKKIYTERNTGFVIIVVWLLAMTLASPPLIGWARYDYLPGQSFCFAYWKASITYTFFMVIVCFGGPCSVMSFCYYNILREVRRSRKRLAAGPGADTSSISTISNNNSSLRRQAQNPEGNGAHQQRRSNGGFAGSENDSLEQVKKSKMALIHQQLARQFSRKRVRVEPVSPESDQSSSGLVSDGDRPRSLPTRIPSIQVQSIHSSPQRTASPNKTSTGHQPDNQPASKPLKTRLFDFNRSVSLESRRGCGNKFLREMRDHREDGGSVSGRSSPMIGRQLPISTLPVPGHKTVGLRKRRTKTASEQRRKQEELRLTKSFLVVILVFILCWFPFCITMFWSVFSPHPVYRPADMASLLLGFFNSCCNPVIYGVMNTRFRAGFRHILCCRWASCYRKRTGMAMPDRGFGSVTGTANAAYNDDISCTAD